MILSTQGREHLEIELVTDPQLTEWSATFDGGETWHDAEAVPDSDPPAFRWLLAGPSAPAPEEGQPAGITLEAGLYGIVVRAVDNPEVPARSGGNVYVS